MREFEGGILPLGDLADEVEFHSLSGGSQGGAPKPPTKIRGSQDRQRQEKVSNIPRPMPKIKLPWPFGKKE